MSTAGENSNLISVSSVSFEKKERRKTYLLSFAENGNYFRTAEVRWAPLIFAVERDGMKMFMGSKLISEQILVNHFTAFSRLEMILDIVLGFKIFMAQISKLFC